MICGLITYITNCLFGKKDPVETGKKGLTVEEMMERMMTESHQLSNFEDLRKISWNVSEIKKQINELAQEIRLLKKEIRTPHHKVTWSEQCELNALKHRVTVLVVLQAFRRGKLHFIKGSLEEQEAWLESHLDLHDRRDLAKIETPTS